MKFLQSFPRHCVTGKSVMAYHKMSAVFSGFGFVNRTIIYCRTWKVNEKSTKMKC